MNDKAIKEKLKEYYSHYPIQQPAYLVIRIAGKVITALSKKYLKGKVLDLGCGSKRKKNLAGLYASHYIGFDIPQTHHCPSNIDFFATANQVPLKDDCLDGVICTAVLEHLPEPEQALRECNRILKKGGHAVFTAPLFWHLHEEPRDFYRYTEYGLRYLFEKAGFDSIEIKPMSGFWITFGTEFNYYINALPGRPLKYLKKKCIAMNNVLFMALEKLENKLMRKSVKWTWMYMVVARK